jgi:hypothetical protein
MKSFYPVVLSNVQTPGVVSRASFLVGAKSARAKENAPLRKSSVVAEEIAAGAQKGTRLSTHVKK